ncbi:MAG: hypothetical protein AAGD25_29845 [Cyanobacteria bacterium P01_F01_bin.150]
MARRETLTDKMAAEHDIADCVTVVDSNGEVQRSSDTEDQIWEPLPTPASAP